MMGGGRNGRYWKWSFVVLLFLCLVYVFYLYRDVRSILLQKERELESLDDLQGRLGQQLKDLVESHSILQEELKNERVSHHKTRITNDALGKQCQNDLKTLKETEDAAKRKLEEERDNYQGRLNEEIEKNEQLQEQENLLINRYEKQKEDCERERERQEESCLKVTREQRDEIEAYKLQATEAKEAQETMRQHSLQCDTQLDSLQLSDQLKEFRISTLETDLDRCHDNLQTVTAEKEKLESELVSVGRQKMQGQAVNLQVGGAPDTHKDTLLKEITAKLGRGETLSQQELKMLDTIQREKMGDFEGANFNPGGHEFKRNMPPRFPAGGDYQPQSQRYLGDSYQATKRGMPSERLGWGQHGMDHGQNRLPGGMGMRPGAGPGTEKQQLPVLAEQEEVRELELEDVAELAAGRSERRERPADDRGGEEDEGVDEQAFDPADVRGDAEDGRQYESEQAEEKVPENLNLASPAVDKKQMPSPHRVVEQDHDNIRSPPKFENPDQAFDDPENFNKQQELEREREEEEERGMVEEDNNMEEAAVKDEHFDNGDELAQRQFEEDMQQAREERARMFAKPENDQEDLDRWPEEVVWNQDAADPGMVWGRKEGVEAAMRKEVDGNFLRRQQVANNMEKLQEDELQQRLNKHQQFGQRDHNL